jgi:hypothetical protein
VVEELIAEAAPDVIGLQEVRVDKLSKWDGGVNQLKDLQKGASCPTLVASLHPPLGSNVATVAAPSLLLPAPVPPALSFLFPPRTAN